MIIIKEYLSNLFTRTIISLLLFLLCSILLKNKNTFITTYNVLFKSNIDFSYIKSKTNYLIGKYITNKEEYVSSEKLIYKDIIEVDNSYLLTVDYNYLILNLCSGVVINKNKTEITIECDDTNIITYQNIENINPNLYSYINKNIILGNTIGNELILTIRNGNKFLSYENYI